MDMILEKASALTVLKCLGLAQLADYMNGRMKNVIAAIVVHLIIYLFIFFLCLTMHNAQHKHNLLCEIYEKYISHSPTSCLG